MNRKYNHNTLIMLLLSSVARADQPGVSLYSQIASEYLTPAELSEALPQNQKAEKKSDFAIKPLSVVQQKYVVFTQILSDIKPLSQDPTLEQASWQDLELYKFGNLAGSIKRTNTMVGQAVLCHELACPASLLDSSKKRQAITRTFVEKQALFNEVDRALQQFQRIEPIFLKLWEEESPVQKEFINLISGMPLGKKSPNIQGFFGHWSRVQTILVLGAMFVLEARFLNISLKKFTSNNIPEGVRQLELGAIFGLIIKAILDQTWLVNAATKFIQTKLINLATAIDSLRKLRNALAASKVLREDLPSFKVLDQLFSNHGNHHSKQLDQLIALLQEDTFKGQASYFSKIGNIITAYHLIQEVRHELRPVLEAVGLIDAYLSMAKLYKEFEHHEKTPYCFVSFADLNHPYVALTDFWNPVLNPTKAIPNSIELGKQDGPRGIIITGQNTAGKSTITKAIIDCILLAQAFGIAPARSATITPFKILNTFINVTDDLAHGLSLFANEVYRSKIMLERIKNLTPNEFCFTIIDELPKGTGPEHAEVISYKYAQTLAKYPNTLI
jgi:DNA mismatch repair protein MutS